MWWVSLQPSMRFPLLSSRQPIDEISNIQPHILDLVLQDSDPVGSIFPGWNPVEGAFYLRGLRGLHNKRPESRIVEWLSDAAWMLTQICDARFLNCRSYADWNLPKLPPAFVDNYERFRLAWCIVRCRAYTIAAHLHVRRTVRTSLCWCSKGGDNERVQIHNRFEELTLHTRLNNKLDQTLLASCFRICLACEVGILPYDTLACKSAFMLEALGLLPAVMHNAPPILTSRCKCTSMVP